MASCEWMEDKTCIEAGVAFREMCPTCRIAEGGCCPECNGYGTVRTDQPGLEDYGIEPEREDCEACDDTGSIPTPDSPSRRAVA